MSEKAAELKARALGLDLLNIGSYAEAEPHLRLAAEQTRQQENAESFMWLRRLAESLLGQGKFAEAEQYLRRAHTGFRLKYGEKDEDALDCKYLQAECLVGQRKFPEAVLLATSVFEGLEENKKRGPEHLVTLKCGALLSVILQSQGQIGEARELAERTHDTLASVVTKIETLSTQGTRRATAVEQVAISKANSFLEKVLKNHKADDKGRHASKETVSTSAPDDDAALSSKQSSRIPSKA
eukprot:TRINITY_DN102135_c0_g1_i1.p1 TRINITY_DN102135_c0_g1~~TRINITY_DN102135_c0_g1_i1.p1  ORF type:complete len:240 (+),score=47.98 TRINITY_DN102135_c0_g1_i1:55-774(+)